MEPNFTVGGKVVTAAQLLSDTSQEQRSKPKEEVAYHNGWRVEGFRPGAIEQAKLDTEKEIADYERLPEEQQMKAKRPKDFELKRYLSTAKRSPVRPKPYELRQAAEECKRLAESAGWEYLVIVEIKKEVNR